MRLPVRLLAIGACVGVLLAACSASEAGSPRPGDPAASTAVDGGPSEPRPSTQPTSPSSVSPLSRVDPCELLSDADRTRLQVEPGKPKKIGTARVCDWRTSSDYEAWGLAIGLRESLAFKNADLRGATPTRVDIGRHEAYEVRNAGGGRGICEIFVITGESSFSQITVTKRVSDAAACEQVIAIAKIVDPKLP